MTEDGLPLGVLHAQCAAPVTRSEDETRSASKIPIEEKKTYSWLVVRDCEALAADVPDTHIVQVMDREADLFGLFDAWQEGEKRTHLLVRAKANRETTTESPLFTRLWAAEARSDRYEQIRRSAERPPQEEQAEAPSSARGANRPDDTAP